MSDPNSENRKKDHIDLAFKSQAGNIENDTRFNYEPLLGIHSNQPSSKQFLQFTLAFPVWISSMTGGTAEAGAINRNLARACNEFGMGMGLGSCRKLLYDDSYFNDFNLRPLIGKDQPFFANLGIAQIEKMIAEKKVDDISALITKLSADGLIVHVNPLQEWLQPEGDRFKTPPIESIARLLELVDFPVIVKEVGQGMGPKSIEALLRLPVAAVDFGAFGGTNFSMLEMHRSGTDTSTLYSDLSYIGHTAAQMVDFVNQAIERSGNQIRCKQIIVSGGIKNFLDGYYFTQKLKINSIYGQGAGFLKFAQQGYNVLKHYIESQRDGLALCEQYLSVKD